MKQIWISRAGGPEVLQLRDGPTPGLRSGEVRLRVEAAGITFLDILGRRGAYLAAPATPYVPGFEVAGTVEAVGQGVPDLKEGERVLALTRFNGYSDTLVVPARQVYRRFDWMTPEHGAALPVSYLTAYYLLLVVGSLRAGDRVLIHNAGSGVGLALLDICRIIGAQSMGTASPAKHEFLRERGLQQAIDYRGHDYEKVVLHLTESKGVDLVLDPMGGPHWAKNYRLLAPGGRLICYGTSYAATGQRPSLRQFLTGYNRPVSYAPAQLMADDKGIMGVGDSYLWKMPDKQGAWMRQILSWYDEALFRPHVDRIFRLDQAAEAHAYVEERQNVGKVLLVP